MSWQHVYSDLMALCVQGWTDVDLLWAVVCFVALCCSRRARGLLNEKQQFLSGAVTHHRAPQMAVGLMLLSPKGTNNLNNQRSDPNDRLMVCLP
jgi:hypothetical protein